MRDSGGDKNIKFVLRVVLGCSKFYGHLPSLISENIGLMKCYDLSTEEHEYPQ